LCRICFILYPLFYCGSNRLIGERCGHGRVYYTPM
jgi:hypothetical protein